MFPHSFLLHLVVLDQQIHSLFLLSCSPSTGIELITKKSEPQIFGASGQKVKHKAAIYVEK
jgi:hypothetical protein